MVTEELIVVINKDLVDKKNINGVNGCNVWHCASHIGNGCKA
jgi:hypothetical protein